ncbi:citryl-CoA lyase [Gordonia sp. SCSIO 19800]|uniref:citryl-CoA lyase n=1 Tax=Gordonia sp. SCSIO 19800 TaxID=2826926 RepID=UPI001B81DB2E|nr:citryl-CoA lyase [Gordonia sp. SCSIO 19800]MBR7194614.1 citryl-CoA lyase [Gordonia sp. SCSIO 19800]
MSAPERPADVITVAGRNLVDELIGQKSFSEMVELLMTGGEPTPGHTAMIDALLVTFADHGVTPSSMVARLTLLGAPEAMQAAVAAGLCGAGSVFLGTLENSNEILAAALAGRESVGSIPQAADSVVAEAKAEQRQVIGIGHPEHKYEDPRVPRLLEIADEHGVRGPHTELLLALPAALQRAGGPLLPVNAAGLAGALIADMGYGPSFARGIAVIARAAGLVGQLLDEERNPTARLLWDRERTSPVAGAAHEAVASLEDRRQ